MELGFFVPVKSAQKGDNSVVGNQAVIFNDKYNETIFISSRKEDEPRILVDLNKKTMSIDFSHCLNGYERLMSVNGASSYHIGNGIFTFPIKSVTIDGKENFSFEIDSIKHTFEVGSQSFSITDQSKNKTVLSSLTSDFYNVNFSQDVLKNLTPSKKCTLPQIRVTALPIQMAEFLEKNKELATQSGLETLNIKNIHLVKINNNIMLARGNSLVPIADAKNINSSVFFAKVGEDYHVTFGMSLNASGHIVDAVGASKLTEQDATELKAFLGHTGKILSQDEYASLKIQAKKLTVYNETTKKAETISPMPQPQRNFESTEQTNIESENQPASNNLPTLQVHAHDKNKHDDDNGDSEHGLAIMENTQTNQNSADTQVEPPPFENAPEASTEANTPNAENNASEENLPPITDDVPNPEASAQPEVTNSQQPSATQTAQASPARSAPKKDFKKDAAKISGVLSKFLGFGLVVAAVATPGAIAMLAVGTTFFLTGYTSDDFVDIVEALLRYSQRPRADRQPRQQTMQNAQQAQEQNLENAQSHEQNLEQTDDLEGNNPSQNEEMLALEGKEKLLLTGRDLELENSDDDQKLLTGKSLESATNDEEIFDKETKDLKDAIQDSFKKLSELHNNTVNEERKVIERTEKALQQEQTILDQKSVEYKNIYENPSSTEEQRNVAAEGLKNIQAQKEQLAIKKATFEKQKAEIEKIVNEEFKPLVLDLEKQQHDIEDSISDIITQENGGTKVADGTYFYEGFDSSARERKKQEKRNKEQLEQASAQLLNEELLEEDAKAEKDEIENDKQTKTSSLEEDKAKLKDKMLDLKQKQDKMLDKEKGPYAKIKGVVEKIKGLFKSSSHTQNNSNEQNFD